MNIDGAVVLTNQATVPTPTAGRSRLHFNGGNRLNFTGPNWPARGIGTRWGTTTAWLLSDGTDVPATFPDGLPANVGDLVVSVGFYSTGELYSVTAVYPGTGNVDLNTTTIGNFSDYSDSGWNLMTSFGGGWTVYGSGWETPAYRKISGIVYMRGLLAPGTTSAGTTIYTLPAGYRPTGNTHTQVATGGQGGAINIYGTGVINLNYRCTGYLSLNNIRFPADN